MTYGRFVAVGDSLTEGKGDTHPDGRPRGFADLLADALRVRGELVYANLARPSVRTAEVREHQVPAAVALQPDLLTVVVGVNDVIALHFDADAVGRDLGQALTQLRRGCPGATILTATMPDVFHLNALARAWRGRVAALNTAIRRAAWGADVVVVDLAAATPMARTELALDRVHPSPHGHLRFARAFGDPLGCDVATPTYMAVAPRAQSVLRAYRTAVVAPRFLARRLARRALIAGQPAKRPDLLPWSAP